MYVLLLDPQYGTKGNLVADYYGAECGANYEYNLREIHAHILA